MLLCNIAMCFAIWLARTSDLNEDNSDEHQLHQPHGRRVRGRVVPGLQHAVFLRSSLEPGQDRPANFRLDSRPPDGLGINHRRLGLDGLQPGRPVSGSHQALPAGALRDHVGARGRWALGHAVHGPSSGHRHLADNASHRAKQKALHPDFGMLI